MYVLKKNKSNYIDSLSRYFVIAVSAILVFFSIISRFSTDMKLPVAYGVLFISIYLLWYVRKNSELAFIFLIILYSNYSICFCSYISIIDTVYSNYSKLYVSTLAINILFVFLFIILLLMPKKINPAVNREKLIKKENYNSLIVNGIIFMLVIIFLFCFNKPEAKGERGAATTIYEYSIFLYMLGFYYSGNKKIYKFIFLILIALFGAQDFFYGGRIMGIQCALVYIVIFHLYKINLFKKIPILFILFIIFTFLGNIRANHDITEDTIISIAEKIKTIKFTFDTAYSSYYTSMTFLRCEEIFSEKQRLYLFVKYLWSFIVGVSRSEGAMLSYVTREYFFHMQGGIIPFFFHFYLGWFGVIFSSVVIALYIKFVNIDSSNFVQMLSIYFIVSTFRWYLYRGVSIFFILYFLCKFFDKACKKKYI